MTKCYPLNDFVNLTSEQEFFLVKCSLLHNDGNTNEVYANAHAVAQIKKDVRKKLQNNITLEKKRMSVLIVGIDSISRLNIIRAMPRTVEFLKNSGWVEMKGYNKMDDNTFPNVMALLTGMNYTTVQHTCMQTRKDPVDNCPFVWKTYSKQGYITAYGEDESKIGTFNYAKTGFYKTPTDYYMRPFMLAAEKYTKTKSKDGLKICLGTTLSAEHMYKYASDFGSAFRDNLYFAFFWMNSFSHNSVSMPSALDLTTFQFFQDITYNGVLNNTFIVFLSDHGMRFGKIRKTYVGWLEERLPFLYIWMPKWYRSLHPHKYSNLLENREKLTSPFDLFLTFQEIVRGEHDNGAISCRTCVSMFDDIPWNRSCPDAGITEHWCTCSDHYRTLSTGRNSVSTMAKFTVNEINKVIEVRKQFIKNKNSCAKLYLERIIAVWSKAHNQYVLQFETRPGYALFEATIGNSSQLELLGTVSRINEYGSQSRCVADEFLKKYCYCL